MVGRDASKYTRPWRSPDWSFQRQQMVFSWNWLPPMISPMTCTSAMERPVTATKEECSDQPLPNRHRLCCAHNKSVAMETGGALVWGCFPQLYRFYFSSFFTLHLFNPISNTGFTVVYHFYHWSAQLLSSVSYKLAPLGRVYCLKKLPIH